MLSMVLLLNVGRASFCRCGGALCPKGPCTYTVDAWVPKGLLHYDLGVIWVEHAFPGLASWELGTSPGG